MTPSGIILPKSVLRKHQIAAAIERGIKPFQLKTKLGGWFRLLAIRPDGRERELSTWSPNLITDGGLNRYNVNTWGTTCVVGSGNTAPANTDTQLATLVASTTGVETNTTGAAASSPYYGYRRVRYRFAVGVAAGNLSEVGVGWSSTALFSRALILDGVGSPTTITVAGDEVLDVEYELRQYPSETDSTFSILDTASADSPTPLYDCTSRASAVATGSTWAPINYNASPSASSGSSTVYSGVIGAITSSPSGSSDASTSTTIQSYSNLSYERSYAAAWGLDDGNVGGIASLRLIATSGSWQIGLSPSIDKDNTKSLTLTWKHSWSRAA